MGAYLKLTQDASNVFNIGVAPNNSSGAGAAAVPVNVLSVDPIGSPKALNSTAIPAGGTTGAGYTFSSTANFGTFFGSGAPTLSAAQGSLYLRSDGAPYYNVNGSTTWAQVGGGVGAVTAVNGQHANTVGDNVVTTFS